MSAKTSLHPCLGISTKDRCGCFRAPCGGGASSMKVADLFGGADGTSAAPRSTARQATKNMPKTARKNITLKIVVARLPFGRRLQTTSRVSGVVGSLFGKRRWRLFGPSFEINESILRQILRLKSNIKTKMQADKKLWFLQKWLFPKMVGFPNNQGGFPTKNDHHFGVWNGGTTILGNPQMKAFHDCMVWGLFQKLIMQTDPFSLVHISHIVSVGMVWVVQLLRGSGYLGYVDSNQVFSPL